MGVKVALVRMFVYIDGFMRNGFDYPDFFMEYSRNRFKSEMGKSNCSSKCPSDADVYILKQGFAT
jgi:hypothetical protein